MTPTFLFAVLLFGPISDAAQRRFEAGKPATLAIAEACDEVIGAQVRRIGLPKRFSIPLRELLALQPRFPPARRPQGAHPAQSSRASVPRTISCCCAPRRAARIPRWLPGGPRSRTCRPRSVSRRSSGRARRARSVRRVMRRVVGAAAAVRPRPRRDMSRALGAGVCRARQQSARSRDPGRPGAVPPDADPRDAPAGPLATLALAPPGSAGPAGFRQCRGRPADAADRRTRCSRNSRESSARWGGREPPVRWGPRIIDLDLVVYDAVVSEDAALTLPHPGAHLRNFVLYPLAEFAPDLLIPGRGRVAELRQRVGAEGICSS